MGKFIDAQYVKAKKNMFKPTIQTRTIPPKPQSFVNTTAKITAISKAEAYDLLMSRRARFRAVFATGH